MRGKLAAGYMNSEFFESLEVLAESVRDDPQLGRVAEYCDLKCQGLRNVALLVIRGLVADAEQWSAAVQRAATERLLGIWYEHPKILEDLPHPLVEGFVRPTLLQWIADEPGAAVPYRWLGVLDNEPELLEKALALDETDDIARHELASELLRDVDFATHNLLDGHIMGREGDVDACLNRVRDLLDGAADRTGVRFRGSRLWFARLRQLLDDWLVYKKNPRGTFQDWCDRNRPGYHWPTS